MKIYAAIYNSYDEINRSHLDSLDVSDTVSFGTQLHGGYADCSFTAHGSFSDTQQRYKLYLGGHVVLFDWYGRRVYEGTITDLVMGFDGLKITCAGYYAKGTNLIFDMIYYSLLPTTNLCPNPSFENNVTDSWTTSNGTSARDTTQSLYGSASAKLTQSSSVAMQFGFYASASASKDYTLSVYFKKLDVFGTLQLKIEEDNGGGITETHYRDVTNIPTDRWLRYSTTITTNSDTVGVNCWIVVPSGEGVSGAVYIDAVQFEQKTVATDYCDGSLGTGYSWSGTAHNSSSSRAASSTSVYTILKDCVDLIPEWNTSYPLFYGASYEVGAQDFTDKKVKEAVETVMGYGYTNSDLRPIYFAIYNHRMPVVIPEPINDFRPNWFISAFNILNDNAVSMSTKNVFNKIYAVYSETDAGRSLTLPAEDKVSQARYGTVEGIVDNSGSAEGIAMGEDLRDMALAKFSYPRQVFTIRATGFIQYGLGGYGYPYYIKAGDTVIITDLDAVSPDGSYIYGPSGQGAFGLVMRTSYEAASNSISIELGSADEQLAVAMRRLGLSGGLK